MAVLTSADWQAKMGSWYVPEPNTGCWLWMRCVDGSGYGMVRANKSSHRAHRVAYALLVGPIPPGLELDHLCRQRSCVNPDHLEAVTHKINALRGHGAPAQNARLTHCCRGHALVPENVYKCGGGSRRLCKACELIKYNTRRDEILARRRAVYDVRRDAINARRREKRRAARWPR